MGLLLRLGPDTSRALATGGFRAAAQQRIPRQLDVIKHHIAGRISIGRCCLSHYTFYPWHFQAERMQLNIADRT